MKNSKALDKVKLVLGLVMLPLAYALWVLDRMMFVLMPHSEHKKLNDWLTNSSVTFAITRLLTLVAIRYTFKWIFGV